MQSVKSWEGDLVADIYMSMDIQMHVHVLDLRKTLWGPNAGFVSNECRFYLLQYCLSVLAPQTAR